MPGPSNLYGVANAAGPAVLVTWSDTACPAGATTVIGSTPALIAPSSGWFFPIIWTYFPVGTSATSPSNIQISAKIAAGAAFDSESFMGQQYQTPNAVAFFTTQLLGPASQAPWVSPGSVISISLNPTGQPITAYGFGARAIVALIRAPDQ